MSRLLPSFSCRALAVASLALTLVACSDTGVGMRSIKLSVTTAGSFTSPPAGSGLAAAIQIGSGPNSVKITQAQVVLSRIELSGSGTCAASEMEADAAPMSADVDAADDCEELAVGPVTVNLPVDGTTRVVLDATVPAGTYSAVEARIGQVQVTGTFTDAANQAHAFTYTAPVGAHVEAEFQPPVTVGPSTSNVTVDVDVASWFKNATGAAIDPTNPANASAINANILRSLRVFEDDNQDGVDDHDELEGGD